LKNQGSFTANLRSHTIPMQDKTTVISTKVTCWLSAE